MRNNGQICVAEALVVWLLSVLGVETRRGPTGSCRLETTCGCWSDVAQLGHIETSCERDADGKTQQPNVIYVAYNTEKAVSITEF
jgi:hypothetical protein